VLATSSLVRRSVLVVPVTDRAAVAESWRHNADAVSLELPDSHALRDRAAARTLLAEATDCAGRGGAEVFVRIDRAVAYADIEAAVMPGVNGVVLPGAESAADVTQVGDILGERERAVGIPAGQLEIVLVLSTARGIWNVRELVNASVRIASVAIDEASLARSMGSAPTPDFDPLSFARGRVIVETLAAVKLPLGIGHPLGALPREHVDEEDFIRLADRARNTGFKGAFCPFPSWVAACNRAFTPSDEQVAYYREVRQAFAKGVAHGTAAVPFPGGRMIDVPVDERAKLVIDWSERCQRRDADKAAVGRRLL
jgi:citrate lyase subunit beta/citryl-CoA lyase